MNNRKISFMVECLPSINRELGLEIKTSSKIQNLSLAGSSQHVLDLRPSRGAWSFPSFILPLCLQEPRVIRHLVIQCNFAREAWFLALG